MTLQHHPSELILTAYASGALADGPGLGVAMHLEHCAQCRAAVAAMEAVGGSLLDALDDAAMDGLALDQIMARIERPAPATRRAEPASDRRDLGIDVLPRALQGRRIGPRRFVAPNLWVAHVHSNKPDGWRTYLLHAAPGQGLLEHGHKGAELTTVLTGAFRDETGVYCAGDFIECDSEVEHRPMVEGDQACLCLITAEGSVEVRGLGRLLQPYLQV
ncbi:MAG TPA: ChrR family anti-sigma-E factor [Caulobacteraceae bacterium]|nr:ChrR family anti-sigma-E factor [Caulobacteraceae bacterium]